MIFPSNQPFHQPLIPWTLSEEVEQVEPLPEEVLQQAGGEVSEEIHHGNVGFSYWKLMGNHYQHGFVSGVGQSQSALFQHVSIKNGWCF